MTTLKEKLTVAGIGLVTIVTLILSGLFYHSEKRLLLRESDNRQTDVSLRFAKVCEESLMESEFVVYHICPVKNSEPEQRLIFICFGRANQKKY